ncbi:hypothetical protein C8A05DRAFT_14935 [Staphylotrichum tortipilum]|uniref:DJ-1/PfpI domain-containing protein n=1 Tax=Staphylotrichum tortipilum TaxID=2831512 RepID=A0AAN6MLE6_9PEZI|nr:hypothetical protein C8A05DRAFT_14935 [Staphylotrichum longicolle]
MTATTTTADSHKTLRLGVFIPTDCQMLDMACVDALATMSHEYLTQLEGIAPGIAPGPIVDLAPKVRISYISTVQPGELITLTASAKLACTHHLSDPAVQPGQLDVVLVPGPDPSTDWDKIKNATDWLAAHAAQPGTDILSICTGIYLCGAAGILKGRKACGPRGLQGDLAKRFEGAGGITNGNDLVAAYARLSGHFPGPVAELGLLMTDTGDRSQLYGTSKAAMTLGVVWQILKAVLMGMGKKKTA